MIRKYKQDQHQNGQDHTENHILLCHRQNTAKHITADIRCHSGGQCRHRHADRKCAAMAASLFILLFSVIRSKKNAETITTGIESFSGAIPHARAIDSAP